MGELFVFYCLIELGFGFDVVLLKIKVVKEGDEYVILGFKMFILGVGEIDLLVVMVCIGGEGVVGILVFVVFVDVVGIEYGKVEEKMGWNV